MKILFHVLFTSLLVLTTIGCSTGKGISDPVQLKKAREDWVASVRQKELDARAERGGYKETPLQPASVKPTRSSQTNPTVVQDKQILRKGVQAHDTNKSSSTLELATAANKDGPGAEELRACGADDTYSCFDNFRSFNDSQGEIKAFESVSAVAEKSSVTDEPSVEEAALSELRSAHSKAVMAATERENEAPRTAILGKEYGGFEYPTRDFYATYKGPLSTSRFGNGFARQHLDDTVSPRFNAPSLIDAAFEFYEREEFEHTVHFLMLAEYRNANSQNRLKLYGTFHRDLAVSEESTFSMLLASSAGLLADAYLEGTSKEKNLYAAYIYYAVSATDGGSQPAALMAAYLNFQEDAGESASIPWWLANKVESFTREGRVWLLRASSCTKYDFERNIAAELDVCIAALREYLGIVEDDSQKIINRLMNSRLSYRTGQRMLSEVQSSIEFYERENLRLEKLLNLKK